MAWMILLFAGLCEIGWPLGLKISSATTHKTEGIILAVATMIFSGFLLWLAQKTIPMGTAYAVWTGIGAVGAFVTGVLFFKDPATMFRIISVSFIVIGIVGLRLSSSH